MSASTKNRFPWRDDLALHEMSTLGVGGRAHRFAPIGDDTELVDAWRSLGDERHTLRAIGGLSNVVISDDGLRYPVIALRNDSITSQRSDDGVRVVADGGCAWDSLVAYAVAQNLGGVELMSGIPGTAASAPVQNIGAYGQSLSDTLESLEAFNTQTGEVHGFSADECGFAYRTSRFKQEPEWIIVRITLRLRPTGVSTLPEVRYLELAEELANAGPDAAQQLDQRRQAVLRVRGRKGMLAGDGMPRTAGSFFQSPFIGRPQAEEVARRVIGPDDEAFARFLSSYGNDAAAEQLKIPAAQVLLATGFRNGDSWGPVGLSRRHIVGVENLGGATAHDVSTLTALIQQRVEHELGIGLEPEPLFLGRFEPPTGDDIATLERQYRQADSHTPEWVSTHRSTHIDTATNDNP